MKKLFLIITIILLSPVLVFASDIEIKSIEKAGNYPEIDVDIKNKTTGVINFMIDRNTDLNETSKYNVVVNNTTDNKYNLELSYTNNEMEVKADKTTIDPGENTIVLTLIQPEKDYTFTDSMLTTGHIHLSFTPNGSGNGGGTTPGEKQNPNTGYNIAKVALVVLVVTAFSVTLYFKTKKKSSFFMFFLLLGMPIIIFASEEVKLIIDVNTYLDNSYKICIAGKEDADGYLTTTYSFEPSELLAYDYPSSFIFELIRMKDGVYMDNILDVIRDTDAADMYEKNALEAHFKHVDPDTKVLLPVDGEPNLGTKLQNSINGGREIVVYEDNDDILEVLWYSPYQADMGPYDDSYNFNTVKLTFQKKDGALLTEITDNYGKELEGDSYTTEELYNYIKTNLIPLLNTKNYMEKKKNELKNIDIKGSFLDPTIIIDGKTYDLDTIYDYDRTGLESVYANYYNDTATEPSQYYIYYFPAMEISRYQPAASHLFTGYTNSFDDTYYTINSNYVIVNKNERLSDDPNLAYKYTALLNPKEACYRLVRLS